MAHFAASVDSAEVNRGFAESLELDYPILSDPEKSVARAYGVLRVGLFAARHTFYIGADGLIRFVDRKVHTSTAGDDIAARLAALGIGKR